MVGTTVLERGPDRVPAPPAPARHSGSGTRGDIQALRALAVGLVVVYHFWPHRLTGGFIGVDVFFAISGFLIVSHLLQEQQRTGRIALARFWARRARRLLPASLLVLAVTTLGTVALLPGAQLQQAFKEIVASTLYVQNWVLAADSVDYLAADNSPSPVQHFWSLSTEEQFYLAVPLLLAAAAFVRGRTAMLVALTLLTCASFAYSVHLTATAPGPAYFVTPTRAWEFALGGLLAFAPRAIGMARLRAGVAWAGWVAIAITAVLYTARTPFPGYTAALPVVATLAVIWAAGPPVRWAPDRLIVNRASGFLGDVSYSVYLWHWPVLVLTGTALGSRFGWELKIVAIAAVVLLARWTWRFVENPLRRQRSLTARPARVTFAAALTAMAVIAVPVALGASSLRQAAADEVAAAEIAAAGAEQCFGATYRAAECAGVVFEELTPDPTAALEDRSEAYTNGCHVSNVEPEVQACRHGDDAGSLRVALVGDSHARAWDAALIRLAEEHGWSLTTYTKAACPHSTALRTNDDAAIQQSCVAWNAGLEDELRRVQPFDLVFVSHSVAGEGYASADVAVEGFRDAWRLFTERGAEVIVLRDTPRMSEATTACVEANERDPARCERPVADALDGRDLMVEAAEGQRGVHVADLNGAFCWEGTCKAAVGGVLAYRDSHHITRTMSLTLAPALYAKLQELGLA